MLGARNRELRVWAIHYGYLPRPRLGEAFFLLFVGLRLRVPSEGALFNVIPCLPSDFPPPFEDRLLSRADLSARRGRVVLKGSGETGAVFETADNSGGCSTAGSTLGTPLAGFLGAISLLLPSLGFPRSRFWAPGLLLTRALPELP